MKIKHITALIVFLAAFGFSAAFTRLVLPGYQPQPFVSRLLGVDRTQRKIHRLLRQDVRNGESRLDQFYYSDPAAFASSERRLTAYAKAVNEYAAKSARLDDSELPREFQMAWRAHMQAWREHADFLSETSRQAKVGDDFRRVYKMQDDEISRTWYEVLAIADGYNARPLEAY